MKKNRGFTLIELLVVIGIMGVLMTIAVVAVNYARAQARESNAVQEIDQIYKAISMLALDTNQWPSHQIIDTVCSDLPGGCPANNEICGDGCALSLSDPGAGIRDTDGSFSGWSGPYMKRMPVDPWGNEYFFDTDYQVKVLDNTPCGLSASCYDVVVIGSYGPDGEGNNDYTEDDIIKIIAY
jgi:general secretion pathway protein G